MEKRETYYVSKKNLLTWLAAFLMLTSAGLRIAYFCGKGAEAQTMWWLCILPTAACMLYVLQLFLEGQEHFYRTLFPVVLIALYFCAAVILRELPKRYIFLNILVYLAFVIFYKQITSGHVCRPALLVLMYLAGLAILLYDSRSDLLSGKWDQWFERLPDLAMVLGGFLVSLAMRPHLDGTYHPTWGDRSDGRRVRTLPPITQVIPYIMVNRTGASNFMKDEIEISKAEKYIREKRKEGLTNFGLTHVFLAAYVRCVAKYPAVNRFLAGQRIYSRGDDIQFCMVVKKEMTVDSPDTVIKLHLRPTDTAYDVYQKFNDAVNEAKNTPLNSKMDQTAHALTLLPGLTFKFAIWLLKFLDYFGCLPRFFLEVSPFHGSVFFTSMGSLGIPAIVHHLYDFGNLPVFIAFGCKYRRNEITDEGTIVKRKYVDISGNLDERICDGFYYAAVFKYLRRLLANPDRLDNPPDEVNQDID